MVPVERPDQEAASLGVTVPPSARRFLPPAVWQQLAGEDALGTTPRRGVLLNAQERLRSLLFLVSTYLPAHLVQQKMRRPVVGQVDGRLLCGTFLFADVSGFTALSEQLAARADGAERLTGLINAYMTTMLDVLSRSGGVLVKFAGDALLAYFPLDDAVPEQCGAGAEGQDEIWRGAAAQAAARAGRAALRMMEAMERLSDRTSADGGTLRMKIGIGTGDCLAAAVGDKERMEYFVLGGAVTRMMAAESHAQPGQIVSDANTARLIEGQIGRGMCWQVSAAGAADAYHTLQPSQPQADAECGAGQEGQPSDDERGDFDVLVRSRRARGSLPWGASHHAVAAQMEVIVRQIEALVPFLAPELVDRIIAGSARRRIESEYRPAVVMFVNATGPEQLLPAAGAGPVETASAVRRATRLLDGYFRTMHRIIADRGGVVARVDPYGDGTKMLILFGAPVAHEDDAARAVSAALAMNEALAALNRRQERRAAGSPVERAGGDAVEPAMRHRIGITRGLAFAGQAGSNTRREYTVMGDEVNLAARLMSAAQWGQILVSRPVRDGLESEFAFAAMAPIHVKGKRDAVEIAVVQGQRARAADDAAPPRTVMVGRAMEFEAGQRVLDAALAGQGGILAIEGVAGIGKSCLAAALSTSAQEQGARVLTVECQAYAAPPYAPWCALLHDVLDVPLARATAENGAARRERLLSVLRALGVDAVRHAPALTTLMGIPMVDQPVAETVLNGQPAGGPTLFARLEKQVASREQALDAQRSPAGGNGAPKRLDVWQLAGSRKASPSPAQVERAEERMWCRLQERVTARQQARLAEALAEALRCAASVRPLVVVIDHAQWIDEDSRALLGLLPACLRGTRVLMMVVGRPEGVPWVEVVTQHNPEGWGTISVVRLEPLDEAMTARLAGEWLGGDTPEYRSRLDEATAAALYKRSGGNPLFLEELVRAMAASGGKRAGDQSGVEDSLDGAEYFAGLVLSRVDTLPPGPRDAVRAASVAGDVFRQSEMHVLVEASRPHVPGQGAGQKWAVRDALSRLVASELLSAGRDEDDPLYSFRQALVREVIYRSHPFARRRALHAALAAHLARLPGTEVALLAHHYELAGDLQATARCLLESARLARARFSYGRAAADCARGLAALAGMGEETQTPEVEALQEALHIEQGDADLLAGDFEAAATAYSNVAGTREITGAVGTLTKNDAPGFRGAAVRPTLSWRQALALAGSGRVVDAVALLEQSWATTDDLPGAFDRHGACATMDRLALSATLTWVLARGGDGQVSSWMAKMQALAREGWRGAAGAAVARLVAVVEEMTGDGEDEGVIPLIWAAVNEVYEAQEDRHGPGSFAEGVAV